MARYQICDFCGDHSGVHALGNGVTQNISVTITEYNGAKTCLSFLDLHQGCAKIIIEKIRELYNICKCRNRN